MFYDNLEIFYEYKDHFVLNILISKKNYNFEKYRKFEKF